MKTTELREGERYAVRGCGIRLLKKILGRGPHRKVRIEPSIDGTNPWEWVKIKRFAALVDSEVA